MIQTWVALPEKDEEAMPSFHNYTPDQLPVFTEKDVWMRLIAGNAYGLSNSVNTNSPLFYLHVVLQTGARFGLPKEHEEGGSMLPKENRDFRSHYLRWGTDAGVQQNGRPADHRQRNHYTHVGR